MYPNWVSAGPIATAWTLEDQTLELNVTIPANTTATVYLPARDAARVMEGGKPAPQADGVRLVGMQDDIVVLEIGSGHYRFTSRMP